MTWYSIVKLFRIFNFSSPHSIDVPKGTLLWTSFQPQLPMAASSASPSNWEETTSFDAEEDLPNVFEHSFGQSRESSSRCRRDRQQWKPVAHHTRQWDRTQDKVTCCILCCDDNSDREGWHPGGGGCSHIVWVGMCPWVRESPTLC